MLFCLPFIATGYCVLELFSQCQRKYIRNLFSIIGCCLMIEYREYYANSYLSWHRTEALGACGLLIDQWPVHMMVTRN